jgi:hypothetical protein
MRAWEILPFLGKNTDAGLEPSAVVEALSVGQRKGRGFHGGESWILGPLWTRVLQSPHCLSLVTLHKLVGFPIR